MKNIDLVIKIYCIGICLLGIEAIFKKMNKRNAVATLIIIGCIARLTMDEIVKYYYTVRALLLL